MKSRSKIVDVTIGLIFFMFVGVSSVRADSIYAHRHWEGLNHGQQMKLDLFNLRQEDALTNFWHQHANNGKHLGFSVASVRQGPRLDVIGYYHKTSATPNPEPATMILMGTGLLAVAVYARKKLHH